jgi:uncharacterized protein (DUF305 family)
MVRLVSHQTFQPSASSMAASFNANGLSALAFYSNLNQFYMAGLMTAPIVVSELALMGSVYDNKNANIVIIAVSVVALGAFFLGIRQQAAIGDKSFLTSMIPHHAGAILMCERAPIQDAEIKKLCGEIISSQQREIDQMKSMLARLI